MFINFWYAAEWSSKVTAAAGEAAHARPGLRAVPRFGGQGPLSRQRLRASRRLAGRRRAQGRSHPVPVPRLAVRRRRQVPQDPVARSAGSGSYSRAAPASTPIPTEERYGLVHVFLGDLPEAERPPIMEIPEFGQPGWYAHCEDNGQRGRLPRQIENALDPAHNEYVHPTHGFSGERDDYFVPELKVRGPALGQRLHHDVLRAAAQGRADEARDGARRERRDRGGHLPSRADQHDHLHPPDGPGLHPPERLQDADRRHAPAQFSRADAQLPRWASSTARGSPSATRSFATRTSSCCGDIEPRRAPETNHHELLMPADMGVARYRELLREWQDRGWRIDEAKLDATRVNTTYDNPEPGAAHRPEGLGARCRSADAAHGAQPVRLPWERPEPLPHQNKGESHASHLERRIRRRCILRGRRGRRCGPAGGPSAAARARNCRASWCRSSPMRPRPTGRRTPAT